MFPTSHAFLPTSAVSSPALCRVMGEKRFMQDPPCVPAGRRGGEDGVEHSMSSSSRVTILQKGVVLFPYFPRNSVSNYKSRPHVHMFIQQLIVTIHPPLLHPRVCLKTRSCRQERSHPAWQRCCWTPGQ